MITIDSRLSPATGQFLGVKHGLFIDGRFSPALSGRTFDVFDPGNGKLIARLAEGDAADVDLAVAAARRAFEGGAWRQ